jgi:hypothetical protein
MMCIVSNFELTVGVQVKFVSQNRSLGFYILGRGCMALCIDMGKQWQSKN